MAIFDFLKKLKFPKFEDDFIQDDFEKELEGASVPSGWKLVSALHQEPEVEGEVDDLGEWMRRNNTPDDPQYIPLISDDDE